jgi:hypothetical protein
MSNDPKTDTMKSAYELALERMADQGVTPPRPEALSESVRKSMEEVRSRAEASLAELEILHRDGLKSIATPQEMADAEEKYLEDRRRVESRRDQEIDRLRGEN